MERFQIICFADYIGVFVSLVYSVLSICFLSKTFNTIQIFVGIATKLPPATTSEHISSTPLALPHHLPPPRSRLKSIFSIFSSRKSGGVGSSGGGGGSGGSSGGGGGGWFGLNDYISEYIEECCDEWEIFND
jgi:uncharacterized membrane protein YgcG